MTDEIHPFDHQADLEYPSSPEEGDASQSAARRVEDSLVGYLSIQQDAEVSDSLVGGLVAGRDIAASESLSSIAIAGRDLHVNQAFGGILIAGNRAEVQGSTIGWLVTGSSATLVDSRVLVTTRQALAFGAAMGAALALVSAVLRRMR